MHCRMSLIALPAFVLVALLVAPAGRSRTAPAYGNPDIPNLGAPLTPTPVRATSWGAVKCVWRQDASTWTPATGRFRPREPR